MAFGDLRHGDDDGGRAQGLVADVVAGALVRLRLPAQQAPLHDVAEAFALFAFQHQKPPGAQHAVVGGADRRRQQLSDLIGGRAGLGEAGHGNAGVERGQCVHRNSCGRTVTRRGLYGKARLLSLPSGDQSFFLTHNWVSSGQTS